MPNFKHGSGPTEVSKVLADSELGFVCLSEQTFLLQTLAFLVDEPCPGALNFSSGSCLLNSLFIFYSSGHHQW